MKKVWKRSTLLTGAAILGIVALSGTTVVAGTVNMTIAASVTSSLTETVTTNIDFATIELIPAGDVITIDASGAANAGGAAAVAVATGASSLSGVSTSGLITIALGVDATIGVTYLGDSTVVITDGTTSTFLNSIDTYSGGGTTNGAVTHTAAGGDTLIHVGGQINFPAGSTTGAYTGAMDIVINYT